MWQPTAARVNSKVCELFSRWPQQSKGQMKQWSKDTHEPHITAEAVGRGEGGCVDGQRAGVVEGGQGHSGLRITLRVSEWKWFFSVSFWWKHLSCSEIKDRCCTGTHIMLSEPIRLASFFSPTSKTKPQYRKTGWNAHSANIKRTVYTWSS